MAVAWRQQQGWHGDGGSMETAMGVVRRGQQQQHRDDNGGGTEMAAAAAWRR